MGKRGPAPKPTQLRVLHGDRKDRINADEPTPDVGEVLPPAWLSDAALDVWEAFAGDLEAKRVLTPWDTEAFANWCDAVARRRDAAEHVEEEGAVVEAPVFNKNGDLVGHRRAKNPWLMALDAADAQVQRYGARFGLTPSDRAQLKIPNQGEGLGAERLLS
ncbi:phage terminase small subunit P27 family [Streptomyces ipomoeae]|uniref:phage terminase small subunit P27 family n=1 Tax=Streptomyces ipomoeae TaxID=103232 RepID=UPI0011464E4D|nr:phage terminase small subunit P27 family [Streptomyces ipomoeae]TQE35464.1 phage terminase small subunit P27 family [Streptomyces ipomoeae]